MGVSKMKSPKTVENEYFKMLNTKSKKISLNMNETTLQKIDELAKISNLNRTLLIESVLNSGFMPYINIIGNSIKTHKKENPDDEKTNTYMVKVNEGLENFRNKWKEQLF